MAKPLDCARPEPCGDVFSIAWPGGCHQGVDQASRNLGHIRDRAIEHSSICLGRGGKTAQFADKLQGCRPDLLIRGRRVEVEKRFDVSAHAA
jgi:hypothetical protein